MSEGAPSWSPLGNLVGLFIKFAREFEFIISIKDLIIGTSSL